MGVVDALASALATDGVPTGIADRPDPAVIGTKPFVVLWPGAPERAPLSMALDLGETTTITCHCLGLSEESARIAEAKLATAVYGLYRAVVDGRLVGYPQQLGAPPLIRDDGVSPPLYDLAVEWRLRTVSAT